MGSTVETDVATVGPQDVDAAGELAPKMVKQQEAHELIKRVRANYPVELVILEQRDEDRPRSAALDADEVLAAVEEAFGDSTNQGGVTKILSARVRGKAQSVAEKAVCVLWETPSGRTARGAIGYSDLYQSVREYDRKIASGEITDVDETDPTDLTRTVERQQEQIKRLNAQLISGEGGDPAAAAGLTREDVQEMVKEAIGDSATEALEAKDAQIAELEAKLAESGGDDSGNGQAPAEASSDDAGGDAAPEPEPEPVEAPTGGAKALIKAMDSYSNEQITALLEAEKADETPRTTVIAAAEAVQKARAAADEG